MKLENVKLVKIENDEIWMVGRRSAPIPLIEEYQWWSAGADTEHKGSLPP